MTLLGGSLLALGGAYLCAFVILYSLSIPWTAKIPLYATALLSGLLVSGLGLLLMSPSEQLWGLSTANFALVFVLIQLAGIWAFNLFTFVRIMRRSPGRTPGGGPDDGP